MSPFQSKTSPDWGRTCYLLTSGSSHKLGCSSFPPWVLLGNDLSGLAAAEKCYEVDQKVLIHWKASWRNLRICESSLEKCTWHVFRRGTVFVLCQFPEVFSEEGLDWWLSRLWSYQMLMLPNVGVTCRHFENDRLSNSRDVFLLTLSMWLGNKCFHYEWPSLWK